MGLPFPEWAIDHAWIAGADWPHADEDMLEALGDRLAEVAEVLLGEEVSDAIYTALRSNAAAYAGGDGGSAIEDALRGLLDGGIALTEGFSEAATATYEYSDDIFSAKVQGYIALGWLVAEIAWAVLAGPAGPLIHITALTVAREFFERLGQALVRKIANQLLRLGAHKVPTVVIAHGAAELIEEGITEAAQGTVEELGAQTVLINSGRQDGIDWARVAVNAGVSALAGAGGGLGGHIAHRQFAKIPGLSVNRLGGLTQGLAVGGIAGLTGGVTAALVTGQWDPKALLGGVISGAAPSAVYGWKGTSDHAGVSIAQAAQQMQTQKPWMSAMEAQARADTMVENQHKQVDSQPLSSSERAAAHSAIDRTDQAVTASATTSGDDANPQVNQHARLAMLEQVDGTIQARPEELSPFRLASDGTEPAVQASAHPVGDTSNAAGSGMVPISGTQAGVPATAAPNAAAASGTASSTPANATASPSSAHPSANSSADVETVSAAAEPATTIVHPDSITRDLATTLESFEALIPGLTTQQLDQVAAQLIPPVVAATQQSTGPLRVRFTPQPTNTSSAPRVRVMVTESGKVGVGGHSTMFDLTVPQAAKRTAVQANYHPTFAGNVLAGAVPLSGIPVGVQAAHASEPAAPSGRQPVPTFTASATPVSGSGSESPRLPEPLPTSHPLGLNSPKQLGRHPDQHPQRFDSPPDPPAGPRSGGPDLPGSDPTPEVDPRTATEFQAAIADLVHQNEWLQGGTVRTGLFETDVFGSVRTEFGPNGLVLTIVVNERLLTDRHSLSELVAVHGYSIDQPGRFAAAYLVGQAIADIVGPRVNAKARLELYELCRAIHGDGVDRFVFEAWLDEQFSERCRIDPRAGARRWIKMSVALPESFAARAAGAATPGADVLAAGLVREVEARLAGASPAAPELSVEEHTAKAGMARLVAERYGIRLTDELVNSPFVGVPVMREIVHTVAAAHAFHPDVKPSEISLGDLDRLAETRRYTDGAFDIRLDEATLGDIEQARRQAVMEAAMGEMHGTGADLPNRALAHEFGHVALEYLPELKDYVASHAADRLRTEYQRAEAADSVTFETWLHGQFIPYCFHPDGTLNLEEAFAEAYSAVMWGDPNSGQQSLYDLWREQRETLRGNGGTESHTDDTAFDIQQRLRDSGVEAMLIGGAAANMYRSEPRVTGDTDFVVTGDPSELVARITTGFPEYEVLPQSEGSNQVYAIYLRGPRPGIDLLVAEDMAEQIAVDRAVGGVITVEDMILFKLMALGRGAPQDLDDLVSILRAGHHLDLDYLTARVADEVLDDEWSTAYEEAGLPAPDLPELIGPDVSGVGEIDDIPAGLTDSIVTAINAGGHPRADWSELTERASAPQGEILDGSTPPWNDLTETRLDSGRTAAATANSCVPDSLSQVAADQGDVVDVPDRQPGNLSGVTWRDARPLLRGAELEGFTAANGTGHAALVQGLMTEGGPGAMAWVLDQRATVDQHGVGAHAFTLKYLGEKRFEVDGCPVIYEETDEYGREWFRTEQGDWVSLADLTGGSRDETAATWATVWQGGKVVTGVGDPGARLPDAELRIGRTPDDDAAESGSGPPSPAALARERDQLAARREQVQRERDRVRSRRDHLPATQHLAAEHGLDRAAVERALSPDELTSTLEAMMAREVDDAADPVYSDPDNPFGVTAESSRPGPWHPVPGRALADLQSAAERFNDLEAEVQKLNRRISDLDRRIAAFGPPDRVAAQDLPATAGSAAELARKRAMEARLAEAGGRQVTDSVLYISGADPRIVVIGLPADSPADFDRAFAAALELDSGVSQAIKQDNPNGEAATTVEYRRLVTDLDGRYQLERLPGPAIIVPRNLAVLRGEATDITLWRDSGGDWRAVPIATGNLELTGVVPLVGVPRPNLPPPDPDAEEPADEEPANAGEEPPREYPKRWDEWAPLPTTAAEQWRPFRPSPLERREIPGLNKYASVPVGDAIEAGLLQGLSADDPRPEMLFPKGLPFAPGGDFLDPADAEVTHQDLGENVFHASILSTIFGQNQAFRHPWTLDFVQHRPWLGRFAVWATSRVPSVDPDLNAESRQLWKQVAARTISQNELRERMRTLETRHQRYSAARWLPFFRSAGQYPWFRQGQTNPQPLHDDPLLFQTPDGSFVDYHYPLHHQGQDPISDQDSVDVLAGRHESRDRRSWNHRHQRSNISPESDIDSLREQQKLLQQRWNRLQEWTVEQYNWIDQHRDAVLDRIVEHAVDDPDRYSGGDKRTWIFSTTTDRWVRDHDGSHMPRRPDGSTWLRDTAGAIRPKAELRAALEQVLDHAISNEYRFAADRHRRARLDPVPDFVAALNRLENGVPLRADILMLEDLLHEAGYLAAKPDNTWEDANRNGKTLGFDWDKNRPELNGGDSWDVSREPMPWILDESTRWRPWQHDGRVWRHNVGFRSAWSLFGMFTGRRREGIQYPGLTPPSTAPVNTCVSDSLGRIEADQRDADIYVPPIQPQNPAGFPWRVVRQFLRGARPEGFGGPGDRGHAKLVDGLMRKGRAGAIAWVLDQRTTVDQHGVGAHAYTVKYLGGNSFEVDGRTASYDGTDETGREWFRTENGDRKSLAELVGGTRAETVATWAAMWNDSRVVTGVGDLSTPEPDDRLRIGQAADENPEHRDHAEQARSSPRPPAYEVARPDSAAIPPAPDPDIPFTLGGESR
ncbi:WXG100-like domain-containing protein [Nocardia goodfellowii]|uniref:Outer membrane channel protein CpnT-like N-terminal domain-containing protein n=1 Tax=Nocardia goodfellowii TaxID=882446 RepID=A0ABS4QPP7_9NOCA|nr:hypothetical protein [Nocardia goodfellowii]MBP2193675.1 hypothetical protein [Nocardia goodfellowii]